MRNSSQGNRKIKEDHQYYRQSRLPFFAIPFESSYISAAKKLESLRDEIEFREGRNFTPSIEIFLPKGKANEGKKEREETIATDGGAERGTASNGSNGSFGGIKSGGDDKAVVVVRPSSNISSSSTSSSSRRTSLLLPATSDHHQENTGKMHQRSLLHQARKTLYEAVECVDRVTKATKESLLHLQQQQNQQQIHEEEVQAQKAVASEARSALETKDKKRSFDDNLLQERKASSPRRNGDSRRITAPSITARSSSKSNASSSLSSSSAAAAVSTAASDILPDDVITHEDVASVLAPHLQHLHDVSTTLPSLLHREHLRRQRRRRTNYQTESDEASKQKSSHQQSEKVSRDDGKHADNDDGYMTRPSDTGSIYQQYTHPQKHSHHCHCHHHESLLLEVPASLLMGTNARIKKESGPGKTSQSRKQKISIREGESSKSRVLSPNSSSTSSSGNHSQIDDEDGVNDTNAEHFHAYNNIPIDIRLAAGRVSISSASSVVEEGAAAATGKRASRNSSDRTKTKESSSSSSNAKPHATVDERSQEKVSLSREIISGSTSLSPETKDIHRHPHLPTGLPFVLRSSNIIPKNETILNDKLKNKPSATTHEGFLALKSAFLSREKYTERQTFSSSSSILASSVPQNSNRKDDENMLSVPPAVASVLSSSTISALLNQNNVNTDSSSSTTTTSTSTSSTNFTATPTALQRATKQLEELQLVLKKSSTVEG